jgi:hypothetical protein
MQADTKTAAQAPGYSCQFLMNSQHAPNIPGGIELGSGIG